MQYISTINEPRAQTTAHAADDYQDYVQAFATIARRRRRENLQVISPTVRKGRGEGQEAWWLAQFLGACKEDSTYDCDIDAIHAFDGAMQRMSTHAHARLTRVMFRARTTTTARRPSGGHRQQQLHRADEGRPEDELAALAASGPHGPLGRAEWATWVDARGIVVTETSCALHSTTPYAHAN